MDYLESLREIVPCVICMLTPLSISVLSDCGFVCQTAVTLTRKLRELLTPNVVVTTGTQHALLLLRSFTVKGSPFSLHYYTQNLKKNSKFVTDEDSGVSHHIFHPGHC